MGWLDDPEVLSAAPAPAPQGWWEKDPLAQGQPRAAEGAIESVQAGLQASVGGLFWRGKLPDLVLDPQHAAWWERALTGISQVGADLPVMALGGAFGSVAGGAGGTAVAGPVGGAVGTVAGGGAGMFGIPAMMREILIQGYKAGEIKTAADFWNALRGMAGEVTKATAKEAAVGAATFGAGSIAARTVGKALVPAIGESIAVPTGIKVIGAADTAAQIAAMVSMPAALQGRLPDLQEFMDAAIVIGGLKLAHPIAERMANIYRRTGKTPAEQVEDAQANPKIAEELKNGPEAPEAPIPTFRDQLTKQEELWSIQDRLQELDRRATEGEKPLTEPEAAEQAILRTKVTALEAEGIKPAVPRETLPPTPPPGPRFAPDQLTDATERAKTRLEELTEKSTQGPLTDAERAERIGLVNAMSNPEALAKRFGIEPDIKVPTAEERDASAQRIYDDVYRQLQEADQARTDAGRATLGDEHAKAVALVVSREARMYGEALGRMPEDVYRERYLTIREDPPAAAAGGEPAPAMPPERPRAPETPEVDLFGEPLRPEEAPNLVISGLETVEVPVANLRLSKEVPQFKKDANAMGVIVPLGGKFDRTGVGPIQVWERLDGSMEVISGRHRLDLARRSGEETIPAQIHREADGYTARQAATLDAQLNIREEQGSVADYAQYFRDSAIPEGTANELGLLARAKGRAGFAIARDASADTMAAHRAGLLSDEAALVISQTAPGSERLQALGIAMVNDGKSALFASNTMKAVDLMAAERMAAGAQGDIFGFDDSAMREAAAMAKKASSAQRKISEQISAVSGASRRPELARKMGVDVQDPEGIQKRIAELKQEQYQWDNWPLYPELVAKLRAGDLKQEAVRADVLFQDELKPGTSVAARATSGLKEKRPNVVIRDVRDQDGRKLGDIFEKYDGTEEGARAAAERIERRLPEEFPEYSNVASRIGATDENGNPKWAISPNLKHINPIGTKAAAYTWGDMNAAPDVTQADLARISGYIEKTAATIADGEAKQRAGASVKDTDDRFGSWDDYLTNERRVLEWQTDNLREAQAKLLQAPAAAAALPEFELKPETPAELKARDAEAAAAAKRKLAQDRAGVKGPVPTVDQADLFNTQRTLFQSKEDKPWYYSELARSVEASPMKQGTAKAWQDYIKSRIGKGVKPEEIEATGINDWLATQEGKVTKEQVQAFMEQGGVKVTETVLGDASKAANEKAIQDAFAKEGYKIDFISDEEVAYFDRTGKQVDFPDLPESLWKVLDEQYDQTLGVTKFSDYQLPGSVPGSYRELVLTLPEESPQAAQTRILAAVGLRLEASGQNRYAVDATGKKVNALDADPDLRDPAGRDATPEEQKAIVEARAADRNAHEKRGTFESSHFPGSDYLAHTRVNDRLLPDGRKVLFVEEIQSDRAQKGRAEGFKREVQTIGPRVDFEITQSEHQYLVMDPESGFKVDIGKGTVGSEQEARDYAGRYFESKAMEKVQANYGKIASAPFVTKTDSWTALVLKRLLRYAAEGGYDVVSWTRGDQQVERYTSALRKAVDVIEWKKTPEGVQIIGYKGELTQGAREAGATGRGVKVVDTTEKESALSDAIGKSMADRIRNDPNQTGTIEGEGITVSSTGMASFYDNIVPKLANDISKKLGGGKVGEIDISTKETEHALPTREAAEQWAEANLGDHAYHIQKSADGFAVYDEFDHRFVTISSGETKQQSLAITPAMREKIMAGMPLFQSKDAPPEGFRASHFTTGQYSVSGEGVSGVGETLARAAGDVADQLRRDGKADRAAALEAWAATNPNVQTRWQGRGQESAAGEHLGSYSVAERLITLFENANKSTVIHEVGHHFLENLKYFASQPNAPERVRAMWETARREFAIGEDGDISTASHEMNARSFERYLGEGKAPSIALRAVFEQFKTWMLEIYKSIQNIGVQINPEVRDLFDRMLATDQEIADARALDVPRAYVPEARAAAAERIVPPAPEGRKIEPGFEAEQASMQPYADELPKGPGEAPDTSHVNYAYINSPMDVKLAMQRMAEIDQANIQKHRGGTLGVKSWAEANAEQARYVNDILGGSEDTLRLLSPRDPNAAGPDVKLGILKKLAVGAAKDSARLRDVVLEAGHDATVRQQLEYMGSIERARMIQAEFLGERAGVARALNALKDVTEGTGEIARMLDAIGYGEAAARELFQTARTPAEEQAYMRTKLDEILQNYKGKSVLDIAKLHKEIGTLKGTFKFSKEVTKATKWEMVVEGWKASILSGPVTHTTNMFGTEAFHQLRPAVDALAAVIGMARGASPGMGESDRASMSEAVARLTGMLGGIQDGVKVAVATFKLDDPTGKTEAYRTAIPGRAGELIRIPLRLMGAEDALVTTMYMRGEIKTLAIRQAFDEQLNPATREFAERVQHLTDNPTPEMQAKAETAATRMTFNAPLGEKGVALQLFVNKWNLQWMIPFIRTPINIAKELLRMSPFAPAVGEWRAAIAKGGVERDRALAEVAIGTGIFTATMALAFSTDEKGRKRITGGPSPDPGKSRGKAGVEQPYSWLIGDTYYEYARIQPTGTLMGMAADVAAVWDHMTDEEKDKVPKMLASAFAQAITNQTFLQGITNFINATSDPARFGPRFLQQFAGSMVPNVIGQPTAMADPVVREVNGMIEAIQARIPGMRQELLPKRDWLGEQVPSKERLGVVMPVREQKVSEDKVRLEAARLDISLAGPPKKTHIGKGTGKLGDVELTPEERNIFAKVGGEMAHQVLTNVVNAPGYDEMPDLVKRKVFAKVLQASHQVAAVAALPPDKRVAYITSISEKMATALEPEPQ